MAKKRTKGANGVGQFVSLTFDISDPQEAAALRAAQLLASKHGRRKQAVVAFLSAVWDVYEETGKLLSPVEIANAVQGIGTGSRHAAMGFTSAVGQYSAPTDTPNDLRRLTAPTDAPQYVPTELTVTAGKKASAAEVGANFTKAAASYGFFD
jgi:2-methylaconitate cis-trans-isomerase PrpF